ncbi:hypothetical protein GFC29_3815 (plasmid) [Anoxybacillus sp. B7M1]|uniref:hypothetical protein n=1 Tax=Anoxybacillus sp. B7M1 TaxID=1490057 RepID=UPI0005CD78BD|nr:hypothetical protein [Anoxybacillus sp. B7M1]ANB66121.1 hypothetical protein GFC29_3815 [Anoxybacillus sp. B7M1]
MGTSMIVNRARGSDSGYILREITQDVTLLSGEKKIVSFDVGANEYEVKTVWHKSNNAAMHTVAIKDAFLNGFACYTSLKEAEGYDIAAVPVINKDGNNQLYVELENNEQRVTTIQLRIQLQIWR